MRLYQGDRYLGSRRLVGSGALAALRLPLLRWDRRVARSAGLHLTQSTAVRDAIRAAYGIEAQILPAPHTLDPTAPQRPLDGVEPGFVLCVSRVLPYKDVGAVATSFASLPDQRLVAAVTGRCGAGWRAMHLPTCDWSEPSTTTSCAGSTPTVAFSSPRHSRTDPTRAGSRAA